ncbi:MFS transporter [Enterococcus hulanensis]|uniref:MFS transporter n=1 Tax=Enterococcus hulanensis TaxID=2559929 RepID=UPI0010FA450E|nr:MFS transporter [Enterococcus hulanensis]
MKKSVLFLGLIYLIFISLGLPDTILGVAWPSMNGEFQVAASSAGIVAMVISMGTIFSSFQTNRMIQKIGVGNLIVCSIFFTVIGLCGFSISQNFFFLIISALPLGLGAGAIDTAVNDYVALHYKAHHMNWLHGFWGIGATMGPIIMGFYLKNQNWRGGYLILACLQFILVVIVFFSRKQWKQPREIPHASEMQDSMLTLIKRPGIIFSLICFIFYVGIEACMGLWGSSFLVKVKDIPVATAAFMTSGYYASLTVGRLAAGFFTFFLSSRKILYLSELLLIGGVVVLFLGSGNFAAVGFIFTGLGSAAIFPTMLHETPERFGTKDSARIMSLQLALAYTGTTCLPPVLGFLAERFTLVIFPYLLFLFGCILLVSTITLEKKVKRHQA